MNVSVIGDWNRVGLDESYRPLPALYLAFLSIWFFSACSWTFNTYKNRHIQTNNLQWTLASVPLIKAFLFWYSCFYLELCSLWMSFGVYITFRHFHLFRLISLNYKCKTHELDSGVTTKEFHTHLADIAIEVGSRVS